MDKHSELEVKFETDITVADVTAWLMGENVERYHKVDGFDTYYTQGNNVVRHRCDGTRKLSVLTVKQRKSSDSIQDRHEVDLPQDLSVTAADVKAFMKMTGWEPLFTIDKTSYIYHIKQGEAHICVALYDVWPVQPGFMVTGGGRIPMTMRGERRRFLEIEIEKDSDVSEETGQALLNQWTDSARGMFAAMRLEGPLNESLLEMYRPDSSISRCFP